MSWFAWWLAVSVSTLIVGVLPFWLAAAALYAAERVMRKRLGATGGWDVAIAIGVPLLAILALVTLVGIPFGVALLLAGMIPVAGALAGLAATVLGLGALAVAVWRARRTGARLRPSPRRRLRALPHQPPEGATAGLCLG